MFFKFIFQYFGGFAALVAFLVESIFYIACFIVLFQILNELNFWASAFKFIMWMLIVIYVFIAVKLWNKY